MHWNFRTATLLLMVAIIAPAAMSRPADAPPQAPDGDLAQLSDTLNNPSSTAIQEEEAAKRVLQRNSSHATDILKLALRDGGPPVQTAVARAIAGAANPDTAYIPLLQLLIGQGPNLTALTRAAAQALVNYPDQPAVFTDLKARATSSKVPEASRAQVVRALGSLFDKQAAEFLIDRMNNDRSPTVQLAAIEGLTEMTGLHDYGPEHDRWQKWWEAGAGKTAERWRADLLESRAREFVQARQHYSDLVDEMHDLLFEQYRMIANPDAKKSDAVLRYLQSGVPETRLDGIKIVTNDFNNNKPISPELHAQLRSMVGDSNKNVRGEVAQTLQTINDTDAATALITQLAQEPDSQVRLAIAKTLDKFGDLRAVPLLVKMLNDPPIENKIAAATALADMGDKLRQDNSQTALVKQVVVAVQKTFESTADRTDLKTDAVLVDKLRAECVSALAALRDPRTTELFKGLLSHPNESNDVRIAALRGLGNLNDPHTVTLISNWLNDPNPEVRLEAAQALGDMATFVQAERLAHMVNPDEEPDHNVRDAAWNDLKAVLRGGTPQELNGWPERFKNDPEKYLEVLQILQRALKNAKDGKQLAITSETMGDIYLTKLNRPLDAIENFQVALDYWQNEGKGEQSPGIALVSLVGDMLDARLKARQYTEAANFASMELAINPAYQETVGPKIKKEADNLRMTGKKDDALQLIDAALNMADTTASKPLDKRYQDDLRDIQKLANQTSPPAP